VFALIRDFSGEWAKTPNSRASIRDREFRFAPFLANYGGLETSSAGESNLTSLLQFVADESQGKIQTDGAVAPKRLHLDDILETKPPFVYFAIDSDFVLSEAEILTLQKYVRMGGAIWGNSSNAVRGDGDVAFRREMRRVIPDSNNSFELISEPFSRATSDLYFPSINAVPPEAHALRYFGELAVIHTSLNLSSRTVETNERRLRIDPPRPYLEFCMNLVMHLLTRWEQGLAPTGSKPTSRHGL
jgi:hypothetical protein